MLNRWPQWVRSHAVDRRAESGGHEEDAEHQRAGRGLPLHPGGKRQRQQRQQQNPDPGAEEEAAGEARVVAPSSSSLPGSLASANSSRPGTQVISDIRITSTESLPSTYSSARKRPRQVERERVVGQVGRDLAGADEGRQEQRQHALPAEQRHEERHVDGDQPVGALRRPAGSARWRCAARR